MPTTSIETVTVVGSGISLESKHLIEGTGPLFSFGLTEHESSLSAPVCALRMETSLIGSTLVKELDEDNSTRMELEVKMDETIPFTDCCFGWEGNGNQISPPVPGRAYPTIKLNETEQK
ncbi:hypothetical protein BLNAU_11380 [Blattamonas nauphoetae]|uniref:Uncharacterized protein n=1 Tax=Blattamonas nauphoetae TaxID=2049346 RepID=A0ABQ9XPJ7_9EUKA|nr:hypothetical protein BLNAU_11380 [Blattamonas nauphoetae]